MATITALNTKPLSASLGQQVINPNNLDILDLPEEQVIQLFRAEGVLLFRGFETSVETFKVFTDKFSQDYSDYSGGAFNRRIIDGDTTVLSVNDFKHEIQLHGEMYYQSSIPLMLWFYCAHPAAHAGETIICDGRRFFEHLSPRLKTLFSQKKLKYHVRLSPEAWQIKYKTDDLSIVKQVCDRNDHHLKLNDDGSIETTYICSAIHLDPQTKQTVFINSVLPAKSLTSNVLFFEDGSEIEDDVMEELHDIAAKLTIDIRWHQGDILMLDNTRIMHGRRSFSDDKRDIYVRLCSPSF